MKTVIREIQGEISQHGPWAGQGRVQSRDEVQRGRLKEALG